MDEQESEKSMVVEKKELTPAQQAIVDEKIALEDNMMKLMDILECDGDDSQVDRLLLRSQLNSMKTYNSILSIRITRF